MEKCKIGEDDSCIKFSLSLGYPDIGEITTVTQYSDDVLTERLKKCYKGRIVCIYSLQNQEILSCCQKWIDIITNLKTNMTRQLAIVK